jgi:hypothetical protein
MEAIDAGALCGEIVGATVECYRAAIRRGQIDIVAADVRREQLGFCDRAVAVRLTVDVGALFDALAVKFLFEETP